MHTLVFHSITSRSEQHYFKVGILKVNFDKLEKTPEYPVQGNDAARYCLGSLLFW